jgi:hypothetical protein
MTDSPDSPDSSDREAILRRRQRFIRRALSGLTSAVAACAMDHTPAPGPCLSIGPPPDASADADGSSDVAHDVAAEADAPPMPCLIAAG